MSKIKEILCLHHSHLDVGYTHPQNMLLELQCDYIDQAIDLCLQTADWPEASRFRWTVEATYPLMKWMKAAAPERIQLFRRLVKEGCISVAAMPMHTTPGCTTQQLTHAFQQLEHIRELTGSPVSTAINHDVNGQPWTMASLLLDSNIHFYITGINIHFGGIPFPRPYIFSWDTQDNRSLPTFLGEHYSLFSQFFFTELGSTRKMQEGIQEYVKRIEAGGWQEDFVYLTAANPPLLDNNSPDASLAQLIRRYNEEGHEQTIRFITPEMLYERICQMDLSRLPHHAGDWTDYWNFGSASTARELKINRHAKQNLSKTDFLVSLAPTPLSERHTALLDKAYENTVFFDEHTWGTCDSITHFDQDETYAQANHKREYAYTAADLSAYLLGQEMEKSAQNPLQADGQEGIYVVNPTPFVLEQDLTIPSHMLTKGRTLSAMRAKDYLPYRRTDIEFKTLGSTRMAPFSAKRIPFSTLTETVDNVGAFKICETEIDTPFYHISLKMPTGRILQIYHKQSGRNLLNENSLWGFFDLVEERIDPRYAHPDRKAFFPRDVGKGNRSISQWIHDWKAIREGICAFDRYKTELKGDTLVITYVSHSRSLERLTQRITFSARHPRILLDAAFTKKASCQPESLYFTFPLLLAENWEGCYDTADSFVRLDTEQLGSVCRDYITVDKTISLFDGNFGYTLACPDAPMVQVGDFQFGKENHRIDRRENPLLLAWAMNNYWDTNFAISQEGAFSLHYELSTFADFQPMEAYKAGLLASSPCMIGAAVSCSEASEQTFLCYDGKDCAPIFLRPQYGKEGVLVALKNFSSKDNSCTVSFPGKTMTFGAVCDLQGNTRIPLDIAGNQVTAALRPNGITFLRICF